MGMAWGHRGNVREVSRALLLCVNGRMTFFSPVHPAHTTRATSCVDAPAFPLSTAVLLTCLRSTVFIVYSRISKHEKLSNWKMHWVGPGSSDRVSFTAMAKALTVIILIWMFTKDLFPCSSSWWWSSCLYGCMKSWVIVLGRDYAGTWAPSTWVIKLPGRPLLGNAPSLFWEAFTRSNTAKDNILLDYLQINHSLSLPHPFTIMVMEVTTGGHAAD